ncbi:hypothetical protein J2741_002599 [Methanolinea mesophila]|uniref:hypothetical protein n=1 Tax=Methanolinea mesophila TaxID=547055 RepID=UPI001AE7BF70|nr:hypothetical protein [Methanolinea mesophila]MBP1930003.1 hypothetical protein [Methanolinea mesophila]
MTRVSELIYGWLGWCPNTRIVKTSQRGIESSPLENPIVLPGSGRIRKGKDLARESVNILVHNRRLLWFSFLILLTFIFTIVTNSYIRFISGTNAFPGFDVPYSTTILLARGSLEWVTLTFTTTFIEYFVFFYLSAGLIVCISQIPSGNSISIRGGLSRAWCYKRPIAGWTLIGALLWITIAYFTYGFYLITVFALPAMVLDNKDLIAAIRESVFIFRRMWVETYVLFGLILLITIGFLLVTLFSIGQVGFAYGLIIGDSIVGIIASLVMSVLMAIGAVVIGIAIFILYKHDRNGEFLLIPKTRMSR